MACEVCKAACTTRFCKDCRRLLFRQQLFVFDKEQLEMRIGKIGWFSRLRDRLARWMRK